MNKANKPYHHGDLRAAIITFALAHVRKDGIDSLSLRACSKALNVSPGAAFRHFKDKRSLATALATIGYQEMAEAIRHRQTQAQPDDMSQFRAVGEGYIAYALAQPHLFHLMFAKAQIDDSDHDLQDAAARVPMFSQARSEGLATGDMLAWGLVHGLASLSIGGHFPDATSDDPAGALNTLTKVMAAMGPSFRALEH